MSGNEGIRAEGWDCLTLESKREQKSRKIFKKKIKYQR